MIYLCFEGYRTTRATVFTCIGCPNGELAYFIIQTASSEDGDDCECEPGMFDCYFILEIELF